MIKRNVFNKLQQEITQPEIIILLGPRQVGKTTLLRMLEDYVKKLGLKAVFFDLEQPQVLANFNRSDKEIARMISESGDAVFIDEFQYVRNISKIFKAVFDSKKKVKIICSGSSSLEIHKHLKESLAGRRFLYRIYPLEYSEIKDSYPHFAFKDYLRFGGMPGLIAADSIERKEQILNELVGSYILKDIKSLVKEENIRAFNHLLYLLAQNQGSTISVHSLSSEVGLSSKAVSRYLDILEQTYVNYRIYSYSKNLGNELKKSSKTYLYDLGVRNMLLKDFSILDSRPDKGVILESFVFLKLQKLLMPNMEIKFWRTKDGGEVDFILLKDRRPIPIEVKSKLTSPEIPSGLKRFLNRYLDVESAYIINEHIEEEIKYGKCLVRFLTFDKFAEDFNSVIL
ncbi:MAG: ATP-binding protein [Candidatus Omnitrophica bacterium]|nr:ATP-binding protein [Candidatus Omnitrophota bacterium]